ncbi:hypothetical protein ACFL9T_08610, partial [Thermodesulfobacteriota bacterium]
MESANLDFSEKMDSISSKLPTVTKPEWTDINFGGDYNISHSLLGDRIILSQPSGYATLPDIEGAMVLMDDVIHESIGAGQPYVHLAD